MKQLHQIGQLNENLMPIRIPNQVTDNDYWFPSWDVDDDEKQKKAKANEIRAEITFKSSIRVIFL